MKNEREKSVSVFLLRFRADFHAHEQNEIGNREKTERERDEGKEDECGITGMSSEI